MNKYCKHCNKKFYIKPYWSKKEFLAVAKYCSVSCRSKGRVVSKETKQKLSNAPKDLKGLELGHGWNKGISNFNIIGEKNPSWKGGITPINQKIRASLEYEEWRKSVFERDNYTCQDCGQVGGYLNADHIKPFAYYPELRFDLNNGRTLCVDCHSKTDTYGFKGMKISERAGTQI